MKTLLLSVVAAPMLMLGQPFTPQNDIPVTFNAQCEVTFEWQRPFVVDCKVVLLEYERQYPDRYFYVFLESAPIDMTLPRSADFVTSAAIDGGWIVQSQLAVRIVIVPKDRDVQGSFSNLDWTHHTQPENITILQTPNKGWEIFIEENAEDFNGAVPSQDWMQRYLITFQNLSNER